MAKTFSPDMLQQLGEAIEAYRAAERRFDLLDEQRKEAKDELKDALDHLRAVENDGVTTLPLFDREAANGTANFSDSTND